MTVGDICDKLNLKPLSGEVGLEREVNGAYICDLLSWVMAHAQKGDAWITIQSHSNIVAVASLLELSCIIICEGAEVEDETIKKSASEEIPILSSNKSSFELAKGMVNLGLGNEYEICS